MTMHFAANDVHSTVYVIHDNQDRAEAWIRAQEVPSRYRAVKQWPGVGAEVVALITTLDYAERNRVEDEAKLLRWHLRRVYG